MIRDGAEGVETLLLQRPVEAEFVPRALVFPGGRIDAADGDELWLELTGLTPSAAEEIAGGPSDDGEPSPLAFLVGGVREVFEETSILLGASPPPGWPEVGQKQVHSGEVTFADALRGADLQLDLTGIVGFARWITPEGLPKRYDTRFYAAVLPPGATAIAAPGEIADLEWIQPEEALARADSEAAYLMPPTRAALNALSQGDDVAAVLASLAANRDMRPILPRIVNAGGREVEGGLRVLMPGEPGYDTPADELLDS